jgi:signal transduction histidine kinase
MNLLGQLKNQSQAAIADIRRLVYALRPPALDDLGLIGAIRSLAQDNFGFWIADASRVGSATENPAPGMANPRVLILHVPEHMPPLPAAVEVAVYRIVQEALTNVIKHAEARVTTVAITLGDGLDVTIEDDGKGVPADRRAGVGLSSMEERAAELGGRLTVEQRPAGGTRVAAHLPFTLP